MKIRALVLLLLAQAALGAAGAAAGTVTGCSVVISDLRSLPYDGAFQATCHNCYEPGVANERGVKTFKGVLDQVRNVELDIWDNYRSGITGNAVPHEWFVRHGGAGNNNNCTDNGNLGACLTDIKQ